MRENETTLTVYFEPPFWVGVFARREGGALTAAKVTFGAEPRDQEVYDLILSRYDTLRFSPPVAVAVREAANNPKRARREAARQVPGIGTKSQQALQLQREQGKQAQAEKSRAQKEEEARRRFALKQEKRREKHKGH